MTNLTQASRELCRRPPDERFESLPDLQRYCRQMKERSRRCRDLASEFHIEVSGGRVALSRGEEDGPFDLNDWSFSQLSSLAGVAKDTVNRLRPETAAQVLRETLPSRLERDDELQMLVYDDSIVRAVNGGHYRRLWSADLLDMVGGIAADFTPPQTGVGGATGLYAGEQDMFCFLIDSAGWTEIGGEAFAPGFFVWNSEVGKRTVGVSTFWFQAVCANHIVWDAVDVKTVTRRHTGKVRDALGQIREAIEQLVARRDQRRDGFARVISRAMATKYGSTSEEAEKLLGKAGYSQALAHRAVEIAQRKGALTIWAVVDALTQLSQEQGYAGKRAEADQKASALLSLATAL